MNKLYVNEIGAVTFIVLVVLIITTVFSSAVEAATPKKLCVFDPLGAYGDTYALVDSYATQMKVNGVTFQLKAYTDETVAANDFIGNTCDAAVLTGTRARSFNRFTGSIEAIGGLPEYSQLRTLLGYLNHKKLEKYLVDGAYEIAGVYPIGAVFIFVNDRAINSASKLAGKKLATMSVDRAANTMVTYVGAAPVNSNITNFGGKFNNGSVDVCYSPSLGYNAFELYKGLEPNGGVIRFPLAQMNAQLIIKKDKFPEGFGVLSRQLAHTQLEQAFSTITTKDKSIDNKWWIDLEDDDKTKYMEMFRSVRINLAKDSVYHPKMLTLMKRIRCREKPGHSECSRKGE
ncbi:hypothetical protein A9Q99_11235 [Gammaproteobacteria bacterium 45_16_T64]|nr:hypothetical protein A9Q99_11235 [Gammaproteobacteria bacterium 45_16_T64]